MLPLLTVLLGVHSSLSPPTGIPAISGRSPGAELSKEPEPLSHRSEPADGVCSAARGFEAYGHLFDLGVGSDTVEPACVGITELLTHARVWNCSRPDKACFAPGGRIEDRKGAAQPSEAAAPWLNLLPIVDTAAFNFSNGRRVRDATVGP